MTQSRKRLTLAITWLLSLAAANYVGGVIGFNQGPVANLALSGTGALETVTVLRQLRADRVADASELLESHLDGQIAFS